MNPETGCGQVLDWEALVVRFGDTGSVMTRFLELYHAQNSSAQAEATSSNDSAVQ